MLLYFVFSLTWFTTSSKTITTKFIYSIRIIFLDSFFYILWSYCECMFLTFMSVSVFCRRATPVADSV